MAFELFAAIYIGSYEVSLKIFELSGKKKIHGVDHIRARLDLGLDVFSSGSIGYEQVEGLCDILGEFQNILQGYRVTKYEVYASTVIRNASNGLFVLDQIYLRTGMEVKVLSNSEHRFISYKSVAGRPQFESMIGGSAAVVDVGGAGIQITLFQDRQIITTQHIDVGTVRLRSLMDEGYTLRHYEEQIEEFINKKLESFNSMYLNEGTDYVILMNDYCMELIKKVEKNHKEEDAVSAERFVKFIDKLLRKNIEEISAELNLSNHRDTLIVPSILLFKSLILNLRAQNVWVPGLNINDGIAYDYAQRHHLVRASHDFEADVLSASRNMAKRYQSLSPHTEAMSVLAVQIFDSIKKVHGLGRRERLLLQIAAILHDCGKYISFSNVGMHSYEIIMASEIIGLTHLEREIVALTVLYNTRPLEEYGNFSDKIDKNSYLIVAKLSAILRVANALDMSHKQKFKNIRILVKGRELVFRVEISEEISMQHQLFEAKTRYFENVFSMKPVLKEKRIYEVK